MCGYHLAIQLLLLWLIRACPQPLLCCRTSAKASTPSYIYCTLITMYNYHADKRKLNQSVKLQNLKEKFFKDSQQRKQLNDRLSKNYKKKVETFVMGMLEKPIVINRYKSNQQHKFREQTESKIIGDPNFYVKGFKHQKDRIKEALLRNQSLDQQPNRHVYYHQFRTRDLQRERKLHKSDMRFKAKTSLERVQQFLQNNMQGQLQNIDYKKKNFVLISQIPPLVDKRSFFARQIAKNLLPSLHSKTHFQAVTQLYSQLSTGSLSKNIRFISAADQHQDENQHVDLGAQLQLPKSNQNFQNFDPVDTSKQVLLNCKYNCNRDGKVKVLHQGDGHLSCVIDMPMKEVYKKLGISKWLMFNQSSAEISK